MRRQVCIVVLVLVLMSSYGVCFAEGNKGKFGIGARISYANYAGNNYNVLGTEISADPDASIIYGFNLTYFFHENFSLELSIENINTEVELSSGAATTGGGDLKQTPITLTGRVHFSDNYEVNPYFGVGVGYYINEVDLSDSLAAALPAGTDFDADNSIGFHICLGLEYFITKNFVFCAEGKYVWTGTEITASAPGYIPDKFDFSLDVGIVGLGVKYYFN